MIDGYFKKKKKANRPGMKSLSCFSIIDPWWLLITLLLVLDLFLIRVGIWYWSTSCVLVSLSVRRNSLGSDVVFVGKAHALCDFIQELYRSESSEVWLIFFFFTKVQTKTKNENDLSVKSDWGEMATWKPWRNIREVCGLMTCIAVYPLWPFSHNVTMLTLRFVASERAVNHMLLIRCFSDLHSEHGDSSRVVLWDPRCIISWWKSYSTR